MWSLHVVLMSAVPSTVQKDASFSRLKTLKLSLGVSLTVNLLFVSWIHLTLVDPGTPADPGIISKV